MIRLLIADDHQMILKRIRQILAEEPDMEICFEATDGNDVLEILRNQKIDLVILDINMPGVSGLETLKSIRTSHPGLPVLMLTALSEEMYHAKALKAGASGFISKESAREELASVIRDIMEKQSRS